MIWRPYDLLLAILDQLGTPWLLVAIAILVYVSFGKIVRALLVAMLVLACTQLWRQPVWWEMRCVAMLLRWWLLFILFVRALLFVRGARSSTKETVLARRLAVAMGALALASCAWSYTMDYSATLAASFCFGLVVTFGLLWRLLDQDDAIPWLAGGALWFGLVAFGSPFAIAAYACCTGDLRLIDDMSLGYGERFTGIFLNANANGLMAAMVLPIVAAAPREFLGRAAALRFPVIAMAAATVFLSGSRSAVIGTLLAFTLLGIYRYRLGGALAIVIVGVAVAAFVTYAPLDDQSLDNSAIGQITRTKHLSTLSGRLELWETGWEEAQGHMMLGQGWGHSRTLGGFDAERASEIGYSAGASNLHNAHLQLLIDVGVVGIALFWAFCGCVVLAGRAILMAPRTPRNALALVIFASVVGLLADTWVHGSIWSMGSPTTLIFWGMCAVAVKEGDRARRRVDEARAEAESAWRATTPAPAA
jgi:O-antigen ligase